MRRISPITFFNPTNKGYREGLGMPPIEAMACGCPVYCIERSEPP